MSAFPYASDDKIQQALTAIGAGAVSTVTQTLLQQILVAVATSSSGGGGGGATTWGSITGTLPNQADLYAALNAKANLAGGNSFTGQQTMANKILCTSAYSTTVANLAIGSTGGGITWSGGNTFFNEGGAAVAVINVTGISARSVGKIGFTTGAVDEGPPTSYFMRGGADASIQMGENSATPADQLFKGPNGSGTDNVGGDLRIGPGQSTGNASPAVLVLQGTNVGSSGTGLQPLADVMTIEASNFMRIAEGVTVATGSTTGVIFGSATSDKIGFFNTPAVTQRPANSATGLDTAGAGAAVLEDTTFTGGVGSSAYTLGGVIASLKELGLLAN